MHPSEEREEKVVDNSIAGRKPLVHPSDQPHDPSPAPCNDPSRSSGDQQIKIRMTAAEFKELVSQANLGEDDGDIVWRIAQGCLRGTGRARVVGSVESNAGQWHKKVRRLESIAEEE